jgi:serine/threonine-protein kinase SRPK3
LLHLPKSFDSMSADELYEEFDEPDFEPVVRLDKQPLPDGVPKYAIPSVWLGTSVKY